MKRTFAKLKKNISVRASLKQEFKALRNINEELDKISAHL